MMDRAAERRLVTSIGRRLRRHWRWIVGGASACASAVLLASLFSPNVHRDTSYIMVSESRIGIGSGDTPWQQMAMLPTTVPLIDNDGLIRGSLAEFHLDRSPYNLSAERFRSRAYQDVQIPKFTRLLELTIEFPDAKMAADLANHFATRAVQFNELMNTLVTSSARSFLKKRLKEAGARQLLSNDSL